MKVATEEHGVITIITAAKQTLFRGRSQTCEPSHMVESGNNLTELDAMTCCTTTCPNYPGSEGTKGPGHVLARSRLFFPASSCKDPEGLEESVCLYTQPQLDCSLPGAVQRSEIGIDRTYQILGSRPWPCSPPSYSFFRIPHFCSAISSSELSLHPREKEVCLRVSAKILALEEAALWKAQ